MLIHKKPILLLATLAALMVPNACQKDLLDPVPQNSLSDATIFATPDRILGLVNGLYDNVKSGQFYGGRFVVYGDIRAEEFLNETTNGVTGLQTWNHTLVASTNEVNNFWGAAYFAINACNIFIDGMDKNRAVVGDQQANQYIGEARLLRALCYHSLLSLYAQPYTKDNGASLGVPLRLRAEVGPGNNDMARSTVAEVTTQILQDLDFAEQNLPADYSNALLRTTRAHKNTAIALKTRVYLNMGRYNDVITEANKIVSASAPFTAASGVAHTLQADVKSVFSSPYTTVESIFSMPFTSNDLPGTQNGLGSYYNPGPRGIGDYSMNPAGIMGDTAAWPVTDARRQFFFLNATNNKLYLNKFPAGAEHLDYVPVIRYAEVLLNLSEAIARTAGVDQRAVDLLNAVRGRSDASVQFTTGDFASGTALADAVLKERRIELLGEGFRSRDCMRLLAPLPGKANVAAILPDNSDYLWPIPQNELTVNKLCEPNP